LSDRDQHAFLIYSTLFSKWRVISAPSTSQITAASQIDDGIITIAKLDEASSANGQIIASTGTGFEFRDKLTLGTLQATTSGTSIDFTSIPAWAKRITISFMGVSLSGSDALLVQIGDSGGLETTGYTSSSETQTSTAGFIIALGGATRTADGHMFLTLANSATNLWSSSHTVGRGAVDEANGGGYKALSATLDRLSIITDGSNTFDAGSINIMYE
jgi:hypothetical protein